MQISSRLFTLFVAIVSLCASVLAQNGVPDPKDVLGFTPGDDRKLASWNQVLDYFDKLDKASERVRFEAIGKSTMDKPFVMAYISAPENLKNLEKYKQINAKLADPRTFKSSDATAKQLIKDGKTIVLITCGIHSTEVGSYLSSLLIAHKLATANDAETQRILKDTIVILVPSLNPDGVDIVKNWYDKTLGTPYEGTDPPELYHKYTGHDNNRDWYAFTQVETQLTVDKIHNVWHPQIVHDIHQMGAFGARIWLPPYMKPVEPNVPQQIVEGYTELGKFMMDEMHKQGMTGIANDSIFDAWTPARAYSHYHGGVRILSETASARLASPREVKFDELRPGIGYDPKKSSANYPKTWNGGEWKLRDITNYMTTAAFALMKHAADNREAWLTRFYQIGREAVKPRKDGELVAFVIPKATETKVTDESDTAQGYKFDEGFRREKLLNILERGGVEINEPSAFQVDGVKYPQGTAVIKLSQPYGNFAKSLLEKQTYPDLKDEKGNPIPPYDVTAHTLSLLMGVEVKPIYKNFKTNGGGGQGTGNGCGCSPDPNYAIYRSNIPSMDEGWTRWIVESEDYQLCCGRFRSITDNEIRKQVQKYTPSIVFPDQSPNQILNGYAKGSMPDELTGGLGKEGVENLRKFVEEGGTLVFLNRASNFAIEQFNLPVRDVTQGLKRTEFYIPGSILRTELDTTHPVAKGMEKQSIAWFENSPAFEIKTDPLALTNNFRIIARYPEKTEDILLSGWALGAEKIAGKAALVEFKIGKGRIYLFGFRPQYRGQSLATFPLLFNAITEK